MIKGVAGHVPFRCLFVSALVAINGCSAGEKRPWLDVNPSIIRNTVPIEHPPSTYDCRFTPIPPRLDGRLDRGAWILADWTGPFTDIQGPSMPPPRFETKVKMLWDSTCLYIGARLEEPHLWATYDTRDMIVYHENNFEVFIDPDGDSMEYYEIEINVLGTVLDLYLDKAYRSGGSARLEWDSAGLRTAIHVDGTVNDGGDTDTGWIVELAIPWEDLAPPDSIKPQHTERWRGGMPPSIGELWRINFSRVQWRTRVEAGGYSKEPGVPEDNWTWTPQWEINMHVPQHWGFVRFLR